MLRISLDRRLPVIILSRGHVPVPQDITAEVIRCLSAARKGDERERDGGRERKRDTEREMERERVMKGEGGMSTL